MSERHCFNFDVSGEEELGLSVKQDRPPAELSRGFVMAALEAVAILAVRNAMNADPGCGCDTCQRRRARLMAARALFSDGVSAKTFEAPSAAIN